MNIGDIAKGGLPHPNPLKHRKIEKTGLEARATAQPAQDSDDSQLRDSIAISEAGRRALEEEQRKVQDLDMARAALHAGNDLSEERIQEIKARIKNNFYSSTAVLDRITELMASDLIGRSER